MIRVSCRNREVVLETLDVVPEAQIHAHDAVDDLFSIQGFEGRSRCDGPAHGLGPLLVDQEQIAGLSCHELRSGRDAQFQSRFLAVDGERQVVMVDG